MMLIRSLYFGLTVFAIQLFLILLICPEPSWMKAWLSMASHWDSEWYEAIATYGYINVDGPLHTGLVRANVVFFPGYPYLARILISYFGVPAKVALLGIAQCSALIFWCFLFYMLRLLPWWRQIAVACLVISFPSAWFFYMAYSESFFTMTCCLMLWFATERRWIISGISGFFMTATRLIGLPALAAPLFSTLILWCTQVKNYPIHTMLGRRFLLQRCLQPSVILGFGSLGCVAFFIYCAICFGSWHLYFDMERIGWKGTADPLFLFRLPTWVPPPWGYALDFAPSLPFVHAHWFFWKGFRLAAYTFSETLVPIFSWIFVVYSCVLYKGRKTLESVSLTWYIAAMLMFLFTCFSLSTRHYESMSRCLYPIWILLVLSDALHPQGLFLFRLKPQKLLFVVCLIGVVFAGFWLQLLERYFLGWWVA